MLNDQPQLVLAPVEADDEVVERNVELVLNVAQAVLGQFRTKLLQLGLDFAGLQQVSTDRPDVHEEILDPRYTNWRL